MPDRVSSQDASKPGLNFPIKLVLNFSVSANQDTQMYFKDACYNKSTDKAKVLRDIFYKSLDVKNDRDFQKFLSGPLRDIKRYIYQRLKKINGNEREDCFSEIMSNGITTYIDLEKEERKGEK